MNDDLPADAERDAWLRAALRHAPDAAAAPPRGLSDAILREARSATSTTAQPGAARGSPWWQGIADAWASLGNGRMATSFAGLLAAVLVGLMWWEQPMDEALPRPPAPSAPPAAAAPMASVATPPVLAPATPPTMSEKAQTAPAPAPAKDAAKLRAEMAAPDAFPAGQKTKRQPVEQAAGPVRQGDGEDATAPTLRKAASPSAPPPDALARSGDADTAPAEVLRQRDKRDQPAAGAAVPGPMPPAAPAPLLADRKEAKTETAEPRYARTAPAGVTSAAAPAPASMLAGNAARASLDAAAPAQPLRGLLERLAAEAPAWRRQPASGGEAALDPAVREWLASIDAVASGWVLVEAPLADRRAAIGRIDEASRGELRLLREGRLAAVVRVEAGAVVVQTLGDGPPRSWRAALPAERASRLRASLPASPP